MRIFFQALSYRAAKRFMPCCMRKACFNIGQFFTSFAVIFALATFGFAHTSPSASASPEVAAYLAAGGALEDLCGNLGQQDDRQRDKCEACRLMGAVLVPQPGYGAPVLISGQTRVLTIIAKRRHHARPLDPARLTRAPPQA